MSKGRLLFLIASDKDTGPGAVAVMHAALLKEAGFEVLFCCQPGGTLQERAEALGIWHPHRLCFPTRAANAPLTLLDAWTIRKITRRESIRSVWCYRSGDHFAAALGLRGRVPVVRFVHDFASHLRMNFLQFDCFTRLLASAWTSYLLTPDPTEEGVLLGLRDPEFVFESGAEDREALAKRFDAMGFAWVPGGVDTMHFSPDRGGTAIRQELGLADDHIVVGMVSRMKWSRGHYRFLDAFAKAAADEPALRALLVGDGEEKEKIAEVARGLGVAEKVAFFKPGSRFEEALAAIDIGFLFHPGTAGTGRAALELMSMARPVVLSRRGVFSFLKVHDEVWSALPEPMATPDAIDDVEGDDPDNQAYADAFLRLARDPALRLAMGEAARRLMEARFSRTVLQRQLIAIAEKLSPA